MSSVTCTAGIDARSGPSRAIRHYVSSRTIRDQRAFYVFTALTFALLPGLLSGQARSSIPADAVWHWFGDCAAGDSLVLDVSLDGQPIYTSTFPVCPVRRGRKTPEPQQRFLSFRFRALPRRFRAREPGNEPELITGTMWETGGDRTSIRLGVSFATDQLVLLNTNHPARVNTATLTERVRGLRITTRPVRRRP